MNPALEIPALSVALFWLPALVCAGLEFAIPAWKTLRGALTLLLPPLVLSGIALAWPAGDGSSLASTGDGYSRFALSVVWVLVFFALGLRRAEATFRADGSDTLLLLSAAGASLLQVAVDLFAVLAGFALTLVPVWGLASISGTDEGREAALKGMLAGILSLVLLALGTALLLAATGQTTVGGIAAFLNGRPPGAPLPQLLVPGLALAMAGLGLFAAAVPLHMWFADLADGLPPSASLWLTGGVLAAGLASTTRILIAMLSPLSDHVPPDWVELLRGIGLLALLVANAVALVQSRLQRLAGYLAAGQTGFVLLGIACAGELRGESEAVVGGILAFLWVHALTFAALYAGLSGLAARSPRVGHLEGLARHHPWKAAVIGLALLCLAGMPLTAGFFSRLALLETMVRAGWTGTAVLAALSLGLVLVMSLGLVATMVMRPAPQSETRPWHPGPALAAFIAAAAILTMGFLPGGLLRIALRAAEGLLAGP
jgi:NADH-quinone oxidoreductase subunit N